MSEPSKYRFVSNRDCEFFPCHKDADPESFNCLFCYCPLYVLDDACGGNFTYTSDGIKDCSTCTLPHRPEGFDAVLSAWPKLLELMEQRRKKPPKIQ